MGLKHLQFPISIISSTECTLGPLAEVYGMPCQRYQTQGYNCGGLILTGWVYNITIFSYFPVKTKIKLTKNKDIPNNAKQHIRAKQVLKILQNVCYSKNRQSISVVFGYYWQSIVRFNQQGYKCYFTKCLDFIVLRELACCSNHFK